MEESELSAKANEFASKIAKSYRAFDGTLTILNLVAFFLVSAETFQRLGALWVAMIIVAFGILRFTLASIQSVILAGQDIRHSTTHGSRFDFFKAFSPSDEMFASFEEPENRLLLVKFIQKVEARLSLKVYPAELVMLAFATLQWGFGDLFHCWVYGNGWTSC